MSDRGQRLLATMITTTTYGTWLPGDLRGYVEQGMILPPDPARLTLAHSRMNGTPVYLTRTQQQAVFDALCVAMAEFEYALLAASVDHGTCICSWITPSTV